jgi:hypothetical protein
VDIEGPSLQTVGLPDQSLDAIAVDGPLKVPAADAKTCLKTRVTIAG